MIRSESAYLLMYRAGEFKGHLRSSQRLFKIKTFFDVVHQKNVDVFVVKDRTFSEDAGEGEGPGAALDLKDVFGGSGDPSAEVDTELQTEGDLDHMDVDRPRQRSVYEEHVDNSAPVQNHLSAQDRLKPSDVCWDMMCTDKNDRQQMTDGTSKYQSKSQIQAEKNLQGAKSKGSPPSNGLTKCHLSPSLHRKPKANGEKLLPAMTASERRRHHRKEKSKVKPWK